jgi:AraC family transcriptional regulator of adaptative response/methylated-DNA-[protein]-cysteine methyltransferase
MPNEPTPPTDDRADAYRLVAASIQWLREHAGSSPSLAELSRRVGLSEFHLQRSFSAWAGVSPKRFLQSLAKERARAALLSGRDVLEASLGAGLSGPGRLHDLMVTCEAMSPGELRRGGEGLELRWGASDTPFGPAFAAISPRGLVRFGFASEGVDALAELRRAFPCATLIRDPDGAARLGDRLFAGYRRPEPVHLFVKGTQFQLRVWEALLRVPEGRLTTYGGVAQAIGQPAAARAVGAAVAANPIALLIPCHRVIRGDGALGGYRWGVARKGAVVGLELARAAG